MSIGFGTKKIKKFIATILIIILGGNMAFCQNIDNFEIGNNEINKEEIQNLIDTYQEDINKIIKKEKKEMDSEIFYKYMKKYNYAYPDDVTDIERKGLTNRFGRIVLSLDDGDYAVWNSKVLKRQIGPVQYAAEYHKDGSLMGLVKMEKFNNKTSVFYEYRLKEPYSYYDKDFSTLKHIVIYYNQDTPITFIVRADGSIRGILYKEQIISEDLKNIVNITNVDLSALNKTDKLDDTKYEISTDLKAVVECTGSILLIPIGLVTMPFVFFNPNNYN